MTGRFTFDVFLSCEPFVVLPVNFVLRRRNDTKVKSETGEKYILTITANSYEDAINGLADKLRKVQSE